MQTSVASCRGLRRLRQNPWECLASFILSACKQITQIQQIVSTLCERYGDAVPTLAGTGPAFAFPSPQRLAFAPDCGLSQTARWAAKQKLTNLVRGVGEGRKRHQLSV